MIGVLRANAGEPPKLDPLVAEAFDQAIEAMGPGKLGDLGVVDAG